MKIEITPDRATRILELSAAYASAIAHSRAATESARAAHDAWALAEGLARTANTNALKAQDALNRFVASQ